MRTRHMKGRSFLRALLLAMAFAMCVTGSAATSDPTLVFPRPAESSFWRAATNVRAPRRGNGWCNTSGVTLKTKVTAFLSYQTSVKTKPEGGEAALQVGYRISFTEK